jgi:LuxR family maltose regulon positive regulatory protein
MATPFHLQDIPLLATKMYIPPPRPELVQRPRLIMRLNAGLHRKLTLISAPAGFGKTTLLSDWLHGLQDGTGWLALDERDNDLMRFLAYLVAALQRVDPNIGKQADAADAHRFLTALLNDIHAITDRPAKGSSPHIVLVLDDYHAITARAVHDAVVFLVDHLPPGVHLVLATRADPPLPIARLRGQGQVTELRQADLRFTPEEAVVFLNQAMGLDLDPADVGTLATRTEGWIAGLQMAAVSMRGQEDVSGFIQGFRGTNRYILDYLVKEVLQCQPRELQAFLLQTSVLDRLTGPLCDAVLGRGPVTAEEPGTVPGNSLSSILIGHISSSQQVLEHLEATNLFVVPLDDDRRWFRYHRLFSELLRKHLQQQVGTQGLAALHRRASAWYEQHNLLDGAIEHALCAEEFERATRLIEQVAEATLMRSEIATFLRWVEALPEDLLQARPALCLFRAWALLLRGRPIAAVEACLQEAADTVEADAAGLPSRMVPLRALVAAFRDQLPRAAELSRQALEELPEEDRLLRSLAAWSLGFASLVGSEPEMGARMLEEAARSGEAAGNVMIAVLALSHLAQLRMGQGRLRDGAALFSRALELATDRHDHPLPIASEALIGLGRVRQQWNDLEAAERYLTQGIDLAQQWGTLGLFDGYVALARLRQAQGDLDGACGALDQARRVAAQTDGTEADDRLIDAYQAQLWIVGGHLPPARRWARAREESRHREPDAGSLDLFLHIYEQLVLARLLSADGRPQEALEVLESPLHWAKQRGFDRLVLEIEILRSLALSAQGDVAQALVALERSLVLGEPEGQVRFFVDEGPPMACLLQQAAARGLAPAYVKALLAALETKGRGQKIEHAPSPPDTSPPSPLVEPLTPREKQVLRLLPTYLSSTEMATELDISVHTVRYHIKNIYGKLGVRRRADAVLRAEELGLG